MSLKNSNDTIGNRIRDLPVCSIVHNLDMVVEISGKRKELSYTIRVKRNGMLIRMMCITFLLKTMMMMMMMM